jgi:hypothetical protein
MPIIAKTYCDICGEEITCPNKLKIKTGIASKKTVQHIITVDLTVQRRGSVNSVSEPVGDMPDDIICFVCYRRILTHFPSDELDSNDKNS